MSTQLDHVRPVGAPSRLGQGTAVEQSRAVAEVQAQVIVAQQFPRSTNLAISAMEEACRQQALAQRAFFQYPRGGETVSGPSVHLARELARTWGNVQYGITELRRDDEHGQSEMMAWAWDVQTNARNSNTFIAPHTRDTKNGVKRLTDQRDIYESNANLASRRLREAIFAVLPVWFREQAISICMATLEHGGGEPLPVRIANAVRKLEQYRVTAGRIAAKYGHASVDELTAIELGQLAIVYESLRQGTVTVDDEFPPEPSRITAADITAAAAEEKPAAKRQRGKAQPPKDEAAAAQGQVGMIRSHFERLGLDEPREDRLRMTAKLAGRDPIKSTSELTPEQATAVIRALDRCKEAVDLDALLNDEEMTGE